MPWPGYNDRVGEEAAPQTFGCIIHQPTAPTTNNYILVGGGGWGSVEHCPMNCTKTHTHAHRHRNIWMNSQQANDITRSDRNILKSFLALQLGENANIWNELQPPMGGNEQHYRGLNVLWSPVRNVGVKRWCPMSSLLYLVYIRFFHRINN